MSQTSQKTQVVDLTAMLPQTTERKRILLVEGDGFTRLVLLLRLRLAGFAVDFTSNGVLGLGKLRSCNPDILLVELKLCGMSGLELIKAARAHEGFGDRPVYVYTRAERLSRATRRQLDRNVTEVFDKASTTREELVQIFATKFLEQSAPAKPAAPSAGTATTTTSAIEVVPPEAIQELVAGVLEQCEVLVNEPGPRITSGAELQSRVSSLASCAKAAGLLDLARHAQALEEFLSHLSKSPRAYTDSALSVVTRSVEIMSQMSFESTGKRKGPTRFSAVFLDEAAYSNRAMEQALLKASFDPVCFEDPSRARAYLASNQTELILVNEALPEAHGLALTDIRLLPLHENTPVMFVCEFMMVAPSREELPTSAPRLDKFPQLLSEVVLRALNEVQGKDEPEAEPIAADAVAKPAQRTLPSLPTSADAFELFTRASSQEETPNLCMTAESNSVPTGANHDPDRFSHFFEAASIPNEPILRAQPIVTDADQQAESTSVLPAAAADDLPLEEQPVEPLAPSDFIAQDPGEQEPEPADPDQTAELSEPNASADNGDEPVFVRDPSLDLERNEAAAAPEWAASISNNGELMNTQFRAEATNGEDSPEAQAESPSPGQPRREDLVSRVCAAEMALYHAQTENEQKDQALEALKKKLAEAQSMHQLTRHQLDAELSGTELAPAQKTEARCAELEQEVAALRQALEGLNSGAVEQQASAPDAAKNFKALEEQLTQRCAELDQQKEEQKRQAAELQLKLEAAAAASQQSETALQQAKTRCLELEQELGELRKAREESLKRAPEKPAATTGAASPGASAAELEQQVQQGVAALARATSELAKERGERQRSQQLAAELNGRLQALHEDLSRTHRAQGENLARIMDLEQQQHQASQALQRSQADLEQQQIECRTAEEQLQKTKDVNVQLRKDLSFFEQTSKKFGGARQELHERLEATLAAARNSDVRAEHDRAERQKLTQSLEEAQRNLKAELRKSEALQQELKAAQDALQARDAQLQKEAAERQLLNGSLDSLHHENANAPERDLEFSKLQTALQLEQVERNRQETQLARMRQRAVESAQAARALRTSLRRQIREPVENLVQSTRSLLELEMSDAQKQLAESVLQDVLLVQTRLRQPSLGNLEPAEPSASAPKTAA